MLLYIITSILWASLFRKIDVEYIGGHVVDKSRVQLTLMASGPSGETINSSHENRSGCVDDIGAALVHVATVTPQGMLVFFPSFGWMTECIEKWKAKVGWL